MATKQATVTEEVTNGTSSSAPLPVVSSRDKVMAAVEEMKRDTADVSDKIMAQILNAETEDDVFAMTGGEAGSLISSEDRYGVPLRITAVTLNESQYKDGPPAYAVIEAVNLHTGD